jgi:diacylglycerol kinase family enzyme
MRWMGSMRFNVQTFIELYNLKCYRGRLTYTDYDSGDTRSINDHFAMVWACQAPYMASDALVAPDLNLLDDKIHLVIITNRSGLTRMNLLKLFMGLERGSHVDSDLVQIIPVRDYMLESCYSLRGEGYITVDGERHRHNTIRVSPAGTIDIIY